MLKKFAAGLLATALIAGPALAQTSTTPAPSASAPTVNAPATTTKTVPVKPAPSSTMAAPAATNAKQAVNPTTVVKHAKVHKKSMKRVAHRSHKVGKVSQSRHLKSAKVHQAKAKVSTKIGPAAKRS
jgi:hypothetical protein